MKLLRDIWSLAEMPGPGDVVDDGEGRMHHEPRRELVQLGSVRAEETYPFRDVVMLKLADLVALLVREVHHLGYERADEVVWDSASWM